MVFLKDSGKKSKNNIINVDPLLKCLPFSDPRPSVEKMFEKKKNSKKFWRKNGLISPPPLKSRQQAEHV